MEETQAVAGSKETAGLSAPLSASSSISFSVSVPGHRGLVVEGLMPWGMEEPRNVSGKE